MQTLSNSQDEVMFVLLIVWLICYAIWGKEANQMYEDNKDVD